jgi:hypothetical protein
MRKVIPVIPLVLGLALMLPTSTAAQKRATADRCVSSSVGGHVLVFQNVATPSPYRAVPIQGIWYVTGYPAAYPFDGSAMLDSYGRIRLGFTLHAGNGHETFSALADTDFAGTYGVDSDADGLDDDLTLEFQAVDCSTVPQPL